MTDFRALCANLLAQCDAGEMAPVEAIDDIRAALAQSKPQGATDEAPASFTAWFCRNYPGPDTIIHKPEWHAPKVFRAAMSALIRGGRPAIEPVPVSEQPWKREGWCDEEGRCWWGRGFDEMNNCDWFYSTYAEVCEYCEHAMPTSVLPHWALPVPQQEVN